MSIGKLVPKRGSRAFTLLELIVVIVILGILAALAIPTFARVIATSELEVAEVTAASVVRETLALSAFNQEGLITEDSITTAAADLPGRVAYSAGTYAAETVPYQVVFGKWEFSGNDRTLSAVRSGTPLGSSVGVALYVPEIGCAFAKSEGNNVEAWSMMGLDPTSCNGAGAFLSPEELLELSAPPIPDGLEVSFGCSVPGGGTGWLITFSSGLVDVFINGVYVGQYASGACVPGKASDTLVVVPANGSTPGWEGGIGDVLDDGSTELPGETEDPTEVSAPVLSDGILPILVEWTPSTDGSSDGVIVSRQPAGSGSGGGSWAPVFTGGSGGSGSGGSDSSSDGGYIYDAAPSGNWSYQVQPTLGGALVGNPISVTVGQISTPVPVTSDGGTGSKPAAVLIGDSALIAWGAVADTKNAPLTGYHLYRSVNGGAYLPAGTTAKADTSLTNGPLVPGTYCYRVSSYGPGGESAQSAEACVTVAAPSWGEGATPVEGHLTASDGLSSSRLGESIAIDGDAMVVGARTDRGRGAAYVFAYDGTTWTEQAKLVSKDGAAGDDFGVSVDIQGSVIAVGSWLNNTKSGSVYVFERTGSAWEQKSKLRANDTTANDQFGRSVALDGESLLIGAPYDDINNLVDAGSAYVFTRNGIGWLQEEKVVAGDSTASAGFGTAVALSGDTAAIGAHLKNSEKGSYSGAAYVFNRSGTSWTEQAKLVADDGAASDHFGISLDIEHDTLVVGSYMNTGKATRSGAAYVFNRSGTSWTEQAKLVADDGAATDRFGKSVALDGDTIIVGTTLDDDKGIDSGSTYVFTGSGNTWIQQTKLLPKANAGTHEFGSAVAISGSKIVVGAPNDGIKGSKSGSFYSFTP